MPSNLSLKTLDSQASGLVRFRNCKVLREGTLEDDELWVERGSVINPEPVFFDAKRKPDFCVDCQGAIVAPGFIDVQINGGFGMDFSSADSKEKLQNYVRELARRLLQYGVTSFCPTIVSSDPGMYKNIIQGVKRFDGTKTSAGILGLHLEGPFISYAKRGAHKPSLIRESPSGLHDMLDLYGSADNISVVTVAPEVPFAVELTRHLVERGVKVSMGHSQATLAQAETLFSSGATCLTHVFNAMGPFHHKDPGLVGMLASGHVSRESMVYFGLIADGIHTEDAALRIAHKTHPDGLILISDANAGLGLGDGVHLLGEQEVEIQNRHACIKGTSVLAGSVCPISECIQVLQQAARCSKAEALDCATLHPAQFLGITDRKGTLEFGTDADFVILNSDDLSVLATFVGGELAFKK